MGILDIVRGHGAPLCLRSDPVRIWDGFLSPLGEDRKRSRTADGTWAERSNDGEDTSGYLGELALEATLGRGDATPVDEEPCSERDYGSLNLS